MNASIFMTNGTATLSGRIYDAASSNGIGGVFLQFSFDAGPSSSLFGIGFTDTNGNYVAGVNSNIWKVKFDSPRLSRRAYVAPQGKIQADASSGAAANINVALSVGNAAFFGRIVDVSNTPFANISFAGNDDLGLFKANGYSDTNGNYVVAVLANPTNAWSSQPSGGDNPTLGKYLIGGGGGSVILAPGDTVLQNYTLLLATAQISGKLSDNSQHPVSGIDMNATANIGGVNYSTAFVETDASGNYTLGAAPGTWNVLVNCCGETGLDSQNLTDLFPQHIVTIPPTSAVLNITVYPAGTPLLQQQAHFSGTSFGLLLNGAVGQSYQLQATTNLGSTNWLTVLTTNLLFNPVFLIDTNAGSSSRFYRARLVTP